MPARRRKRVIALLPFGRQSSHNRDPAFAHRHPGPRLIGRPALLAIIRLEPPYCAASLVARAAIDYTAALSFVLR